MQSAPDTAPDASSVLPAVRVLIPTTEPGPWFSETLQSLFDQDYPDLSVSLIVDSPEASEVQAFVERFDLEVDVVEVEPGIGFGERINEGVGTVEEPLLLICHDDVALDAGVVSALVREQQRRVDTNILIGPKLVDWEHPGRLLPAAFDADRFGETASLVRAGDLDQGQQDRVSEVFGISTACLLVARDFFTKIGGFDPAITWHGEGHDLALRARSAGAKVFLSAAVAVRHRSDFEERGGPSHARRIRRHQLRSVLSTTRGWQLPAVLLGLALLHAVEFVFAVIRLDFDDLRAIPGAWLWNLRHITSLAHRRRAVRSTRLGDEVGPMRRRGSVRISDSIDRRLYQREESADRGETITSVTRAVSGVVLFVVLAFGARHLLTRPIPAIGEFRLLPADLGELTRDWWSGWRTGGMGSEGFAPAALPLLDVFGVATLGYEGLLRTILVVAPLPIGVVGMWRLFSSTSSARAPFAAAALYAASPLPYNALTGGSAKAMILYAALPWIFTHLVGVNSGDLFVRPERRSVSMVALLAMLTLVGAFVPWVGITFAVIIVGLVVGSFLAGDLRGVASLVAFSAVALAGAALLNAPYLTELRTWESFATAGTSETDPLPLEIWLTLRTGPVGSSILGWAVFAPALLPLLVGRGRRFTWAMRAWGVLLAAWSLAWVTDNGWVDLATPEPEVLLAPVALAFAVLAGIAALVVDREVAEATAARAIPAVVATLGFGLALLPLVEGTFSGRWGVPRADLATTLTAIEAAEEEGAYRVVWLADPHVLGSAGYPTGNGLAWASSVNGVPDVRAAWTDDGEPATLALTDAIAAGTEGRTSRLGRELSRFGVRFIVVIDQQAPVPLDSRAASVSTSLASGLTSQLDLTRTGVVNPAVVVFENRAWTPMHAAVEPDALVDLRLDGALPAVSRQDASDLWSGQVRVQRDFYAAWEPSPRWTLTVDEQSIERVDVGSVGMGFRSSSAGDVTAATLAYGTDDAHRLVLGAQIAAWLALAVARRWIVGRDRRAQRQASVRLERAA